MKSMQRLSIFLTLSVLGLINCTNRHSETLSDKEREDIVLEVKNTLKNYYSDIKKSGLTAEFKYLDHSKDFFWVPPGYSSALSFDTISEILKRNAPKYSLIENVFDTLTIVPLNKGIAIYTGRLRSVMTDTAGITHSMGLVETGVIIKKGNDWKLVSGQTNLLPDDTGLANKNQLPPDKSGLGYFSGEWDFKIWFNGNNSDKPDISAKWILEKSLDKVECYTGYVLMDGNTFTREIIVFNSNKNEYERTVMTNSGVNVSLKTKGWNGNKLIWTGHQYSVDNKTELKEEIIKHSDNKFEAKFYQLQNDKWELTQTEFLTRRN